MKQENEQDLDRRLQKKAAEEVTRVPEDFSHRVDETLEALPRKPGRRTSWRWISLAAAMLALAVALPNLSPTVANAMGELPVLGPLFRAVTFREYEVQTEHTQISISVPEVVAPADGAGAQTVNAQVQAYTDQLIAQYEAEMSDEGYFNLDVDWEIITNTDRWFTLKINTDLVMAGAQHEELYYHIDAATGEEMTLSDLFAPDFDYVRVMSEELKTQMRARMDADAREIYWLAGETDVSQWIFEQLSPDHSFYFDAGGKLVIPFDKYEVGPGSTGSPRFTLESPELYENLLHQP